MDKNKSIIRTKKSTSTIAKLLAKEGAVAIIPGGGLAFDAISTLFSHGRAYFSDRTEDRMEEFHSALLSGKGNEEDFSSFINKPFDLDDYYAVLSSCTQDIENEKVEIYSTLMSSLIKSELEQDLRRHFIKSCKELTYSDLCFLKDLYINSKHDLMTVGGVHQQVISMLSSKDRFRLLTIDKLKSFGFIDMNEKSITSLAESFVSLIFNAQALTPESIGRKPFSGINIAIVSYQLGNESHITIATEMQEALHSKQIKSSIHTLNSQNLTNNILINGAAVLIVDEEPIAAEYIKSLIKFSEKRPLIRLNMNDTSNKKLLADVNFFDEITLKSTERLAVRKQLNEYISRVLN